MDVAATIASLLLAAVLIVSAAIKLTRREPYVQGYLRVGVPEARLNLLAAVLLAGAAGLVLGLAWSPIGVAAAAALVLYFAAAIAAHLRAGDAANLPTPVAMETIAAAALVLTVATL
jgi:DoxX-like family